MSLLLLPILLTGYNPVPDVASLTRGQEIEISASSSGCFHHLKATMKVTGGDSRHFSYYRSLEGQLFVADSLRQELDLVYDGPLTAELESQLQLWIDFYREATGKQGGCTTYQSFDLEYRGDGHSMGSEHLSDAGCLSTSLSLYFQKDMPDELLDRVETLFPDPEKYREMKALWMLIDPGGKPMFW